ncbi:spore germination protein PC [Gracilibacillus ureilyticus]|uniref:Spore germination protein PC n=1 Tax=Gracilibacillus ureilyticus TaxID=531814 RepID=A0A1H9SMM7_9BACI|nr:spore germination protein GerPC [Gracilibacillus ureilyticus]SER86138.1 spore germination protein PC [Gracilibacillus ureilyticus]
MDYPALVFYVNQLQQHIQQLQLEINSLETRISQLEQKEGSPKTTIEKLEYHFDQLKIERLDGTLHIGISPEDLNQTDDFSLPFPNHPSPNYLQELNQYTETELPQFIGQLEEEYQYRLTDDYRKILLDDIRKQLPGRISYYASRNDNDQSWVVQQVIGELHHGLHKWFQQQIKKE